MSENYYLDRQQREYLLKDLATLLEHIRDLDNVLTRQTRYHGQGRHSADSPLPFSVQASDFRHEIAAALPGICEILGYTTPFAHTTSIIDCLTWLSRNHMKLAAYEDAEKLADDIASWARRIVTIVDRPKYPDTLPHPLHVGPLAQRQQPCSILRHPPTGVAPLELEHSKPPTAQMDKPPTAIRWRHSQLGRQSMANLIRLPPARRRTIDTQPARSNIHRHHSTTHGARSCHSTPQNIDFPAASDYTKTALFPQVKSLNPYIE